MSYHERRGGYRRRYRDDYDDRRREVYESPEEVLKNAIMKLGEVDVLEELPRLTKQIRSHALANVSNVAESIRTAVTEQPYKIPYYAALVQLLHDPPSPEDTTSESHGPSLGRQILEDFWKGFQTYLDKLSWREARFSVHFFAHLTGASLVSSSSMTALLQSFTAVLDEFGVSYTRAKKATVCVAEGLMICGERLEKDGVDDMIKTIEGFAETTKDARWLVGPMAKFFPEADSEECDELFGVLLSTLRKLAASNFTETANSYPQPYLSHPPPSMDFTPFDLPSVLVPPEVIDLDGSLPSMDVDGGVTDDALNAGPSQVKKEEWPEIFVRLFDNEVTPDPTSPPGYAIRSALLSITDIFEVNRKECARLLLEYPKWSLRGTFKPKPGAPPPTVHDGENGIAEVETGRDWQLESTIVETILNALLCLPFSSHKSVYYISLITELCKLSPSTAGPAVGKSIRRLYVLLGDGLDVEMARRFAEWFSVHMSNFGFGWVWKEWIQDLSLSPRHPKRCFMRYAVELEIRLAYHDRILKTLPPAFQDPEALVISGETPGPNFDYEDPARLHHDAAQDILNLFRGRAKAEDVISHLHTLKATLAEEVEGGGAVMDIDSTVRDIVVQSLLHVGSRSFSHLLNAIERYLPLLRNVAGITGSDASSGVRKVAEAKLEILSSAARFWCRNRQMVAIVFDKVMQYQIVDPSDIVDWIFDHNRQDKEHPGFLSGWEWELMRAALDKANGRVTSAKRKIATLRKEEDDARAREKAGLAVVMEVDADTGAKPEDVIENPALTTALKALSTLTKEQRTALSRALDGFMSCLGPSDSNATFRTVREVITEGAWHNRANWRADEWNAWETWGWYRQFCRAYSPYLRCYQTTLWTISFTKFEGSTEYSAEVLRRIWSISVGQE